MVKYLLLKSLWQIPFFCWYFTAERIWWKYFKASINFRRCRWHPLRARRSCSWINCWRVGPSMNSVNIITSWSTWFIILTAPSSLHMLLWFRFSQIFTSPMALSNLSFSRYWNRSKNYNIWFSSWSRFKHSVVFMASNSWESCKCSLAHGQSKSLQSIFHKKA
jgi:hypothetical protein